MRAQSTIIGFLLITLIALVIVGATFFWGKPLIERSLDFDELSRLENRMLELHTAIKKVANEQSQATVPFTITKGTLALDPKDNEIIFEANLDVPIAVGRELLDGTVNTTLNSSDIGKLGVDEPAILLERKKVELNLRYILLNDSITGDCYGIDLQPGTQSTAGVGSHKVLLKWTGENRSSTFSGCRNVTLQIVTVNIE